MIGYFLALLPIYIFIYQPVSQFFFPSSSSHGRNDLTFNASFIAPPEDPNLTCPDHKYVTHILSREPLVLYLEGWLAEEEIGELLDIRYVTSRHIAVSNNSLLSTAPPAKRLCADSQLTSNAPSQHIPIHHLRRLHRPRN
jgi:hypothetical protein